MKICISILAFVISTASFATVVKSWDADQTCSLYRVVNEETPIASDEVIVFDKNVYGLSLQNMEIDFENKNVLVVPVMNVVLGLNRPLISDKIFISAENPDFKFLINQLNRKLYVFEKMCISSSNELIYANMFETKN